MQKVTGVSSVRVSLNEGLTVLDFKPGNTVTLARLREVIRNNGFVTREAKIIAAGSIVTSGSGLALEIAGTRERLSVMKNPAQLKADPSAAVLVTGSADITDPKAMKVVVSAVGQPFRQTD